MSVETLAGSHKASPTTLPRLLVTGGAPGATVDLRTHLDLHGRLDLPPLVRGGDAELRKVVADSGLRGRGGAGFPSAVKMDAVARSAKRAVVVANASEGEPASRKDQVLLRTAPHLVLDGIQLGAIAVGATDAFLYLHRGSPAHAIVERALVERTDDKVPVTIVTAPNRYVAGEETALVNRINGGLAKPMYVPPRPFESGVGGRPTLIQNAETLAHLALIARFGSTWFRGLGTGDDPGSSLVTLSGAVKTKGVAEIALGTSLRELTTALGGTSGTPTAVLLGGYFGGWRTADSVWDVPLGHASLRAAGASFGAGIIAVIDDSTCGLAETARILRYFANESAQQCGPCLNGLPAIATAFETLTFGRDRKAANQSVNRLQRWIGLVSKRGACAMPDGAAQLAKSALETFAAEIDAHVRRGPCAATNRALLPVHSAPSGEGWS
ncbi:MAG: NADH-ubiquinone oxidoreductase-F iron-sulfur binding region domain-containing protein [Actinomycetes bacterium]